MCWISDDLCSALSECADSPKGDRKVINCANAVLKEHSYWPLVSDLINLFSHRDVALYFMSDTVLLTHWASIMACFQGILNVIYLLFCISKFLVIYRLHVFTVLIWLCYIRRAVLSISTRSCGFTYFCHHVYRWSEHLRPVIQSSFVMCFYTCLINNLGINISFACFLKHVNEDMLWCDLETVRCDVF